ncbi:MAG: FAD-dependent oxidoreductase, partial [Deltaproteobacteria bacterium]|nr:FAD-dependent oxidoreductase [Deltaproteobacteria bacterium]
MTPRRPARKKTPGNFTRQALAALAACAALLAPPAQANQPCEDLAADKEALTGALPKDPEGRAAFANYLEGRYGVDPREVQWGKDYPFVIRGGGERTYEPKADFDHAEADPNKYDVIIVGSGPAGLTAATYLSEAGKRVLILERDKTLGGLGQGGERKGVHYGRGAAYFSEIEGLTYKIYRHLGLGKYKKEFPIPEPIDSFYWNGKYYEGLWENPKAMEELPASFELFKFYLRHFNAEGKVASQPMELDPETRALDQLSMAQWVRTYPGEMAKLAETDAEARRVYDRFLKDDKLSREDPMRDVIGLLDLYGRSALGDHAARVSAAAFANFYAAELETRYTGNLGAGNVTQIIEGRLARHEKLLTIKTEAPAARLANTPEGVDVYYVKDGKTYKARAGNAIFAASLNVGAHIIQDFEQQAPEQFKAVESLKHRHYLVINMHVKGQPWKRTYDLWVRDDGTYSQADPTDIIDGRWTDFEGTKNPRTGDDRGVITIYLPLPESATHEQLTDAHTIELAERAVKKAQELLNPLAQKYDDGKTVTPVLTEVNRWLYSIHLVEPGHFTKALELKKPVGNINFADNNLGVPSVEEAIYRGYEAAQATLKA